MKVLMIGDVVGRPGRQVIREVLPDLRDELEIDLVVANGENAAGGNGITRGILDEFYSLGVDVVTSGNHIWDKKEILDFIDDEERLLRPGNYPPGTPGRGYTIFKVKGESLAVLNLAGRSFMNDLDCPFRKVDSMLAEIGDRAKLSVLDFHAETTSEKLAMGWYLDGRITAVVGTHTHVPTADFRILPGGTAYITDLGMTGPRNSVLGVKSEIVIQKFIRQLPVRFEVASGPNQFNAVVIDLDGSRGRARGIYQVIRYQED